MGESSDHPPIEGEDKAFYSAEYDSELKALEKELHEQAAALGNVEPLQQRKTDPLAEQVQDQNTKEFVTLVEFIKKEHGRTQQMKDPQHKAKVVKMKAYQKVKEKEFDKIEKQKGLQLNKAA